MFAAAYTVGKSKEREGRMRKQLNIQRMQSGLAQTTETMQASEITCMEKNQIKSQLCVHVNLKNFKIGT